jgi:hypothetical protein
MVELTLIALGHATVYTLEASRLHHLALLRVTGRSCTRAFYAVGRQPFLATAHKVCGPVSFCTGSVD